MALMPDPDHEDSRAFRRVEDVNFGGVIGPSSDTQPWTIEE